MEVEAEKQQLINQLAALDQYVQHPVTKEIFRDLDEGAEALVKMICDVPICDVETFFAHFESVGHLRGLRRAKALVQENLEDVKAQLKELEKEV